MSRNDNHIAKAEQLYALGEENEIVRRFQLISRTGEIISVPYSLLPAFILTENCDIIIRAYGLLVVIQGRNLRALENYFNDEKVLWIRESASGTDTGDAHIFITSIQITGRSVSKELRKGEE
jgi:hypothetical protein